MEELTLISVLQELSEVNDRGIHIIQDASRANDLFLSYSQLFHEASGLLSNLQQAGVQVGQEVLIQVAEIKDFLPLFWACVLGKFIPVPLSTGDRAEYSKKILNILGSLDSAKVVVDEKRHELLINATEIDQENLGNRLLAIGELKTAIANTAHLPGATPDDIAFIQYSSGSTSLPKGVTLTHANLIHNTADIMIRSNIDHSDKTLCWMPLTHDMGMIGFHLTSMLAGIDQVIFPPSLFVRRPVLWLELASQFRATVLYSPNFGFRHTLDGLNASPEAPELDLSSVKIIYNGAEPISHTLVEEFNQQLVGYGLSSKAVLPCYGMAEASVAVTLPTPGDVLKTHHLSREKLATGELDFCQEAGEACISFVETGPVIDHCNIRICDDHDSSLQECNVGQIQIKGKNVTNGYYERPDLNEALFTSDGWLKTGDIGFIKDNRLVITGRMKNLIIINGQNYYPQDFENLVSELPEVNLGAAAVGIRANQGWEEQLVMFVVYKSPPGKFASIAEKVTKHFESRTGLRLAAVVPIKRLPKTTSGKVKYFSMAEDYQHGKFDEIIAQYQENQPEKETFTEQSIKQILAALFEEIFEFQPEVDLPLMESSALNSLKVMQYLSRINRKLGTAIGFKDIFQFETLEGLGTYLSTLKPVGAEEKIPVIDPQTDYALTTTQQRLYHLDQLSDTFSNNIGVAWKISGTAEPEKIVTAFKTLVARHENLRTQWISVNDEVRLRYRLPDEMIMSIESLEDASNESLSNVASRRFHLDREDPIRIFLVQAEDHFVLGFAVSHIVADGWSVQLLARELGQLLGGKVFTEFPTPDYQSVYQWKNHQLQKQINTAGDFWNNYLQGVQPPTPLVFQRSVQEKITYSHDHIHHIFESTTLEGIRAVSKTTKSSPFHVLTGVLIWLIHRYTRDAEVCLGTDSFGRTLPEENNLVGYFLKTLLIRVQLQPDWRFDQLIKVLTGQFTSMLQYQEYPYEWLQNGGNAQENASGLSKSLFDVLVLYRNFDNGSILQPWLNDQEVSLIEIPQRNGFAKLQFEFVERSSDLQMNVSYDKELFDGSDIQLMMLQFETLLDTILKDATKPLSSYSFLDDSMVQATLEKGRGTVTTYQGDLVQSLENSATKFGEQLAVISEEGSLTYAQLWEASGSVAQQMLHHAQDKPARIGLALGRNTNRIVALIGVLRAGCSFVPIDTTYDSTRNETILKDSGVELLLTEARFADQYQDKVTCIVIDINKTISKEIIPVDHEANAEAYVLYTSGSSGLPKGISVAREALADYVDTFVHYFNLSSDDVVLHQGSLSFDLALEEIFPILTVGGKLVVGADGGENVARLAKDITSHNITLLSSTPAVINELNTRHVSVVEHLRVLISGGEKLLPQHINNLLTTNTRIYNTYGPTETTVCATYHEIKKLEDAALIGQPINNRQLLILDENRSLLPDGIPGELYIGGRGVCREYLNLPELNASAFVVNPYQPDQRLFKTGDLVRRRPDGNLQYLGRIDQQVKVNGYRIEPGEITGQLLELSLVDEAHVVAQLQAGQLQLVAYLVAAGEIQVHTLILELEKSLPVYMIPRKYYQVSAIPRSNTGKIDERSLMELGSDRTPLTVQFEEPKDETEKQLAVIWSSLLKVSSVSRTDHFFQLGGDSLKASRLLARITTTFDVKLTLKELFECPRLFEMRELLSAANKPEILSIEKKANRGNVHPLTNAQSRLWLLQELEDEPRSHHITIALKFRGKFNTRHFEAAWKELVSRHESLRSVFNEKEGQLVREVLPLEQVPLGLEYEDISDLHGQSSDIEDKLTLLARTPFDLATAPLFRTQYIKTAEQEGIIGFCIHHIIADGWSLKVIREELFHLYQQKVKGEESNLPELELEFSDYLYWQETNEDSKESAKFWKEKLSGSLPKINLPSDRPRTSSRTFLGATQTIQLPTGLSKQIKRYTSTREVNLFSVLTSLVFSLLHKYTNQDDIILGVPLADRPHAAFEGNIGLMLDVLVLRQQMGNEINFRQLSQRVQRDLVASIDHRNYSFDQLVNDLETDRDLSRSPLFDVMINLNIQDHPVDFEGFTLEPYPVAKGTSKYDLTFNFWDHEDNIRMDIEYSEELFDAARIHRMSGHFEAFAEQLTLHDNQSISVLPWFGEEEQRELLSDQNGVAIELQEENAIEAFFKSSVKWADKPAIRSGERVLSYASLHQQVLQISQGLVEHYQVKRGDVIGVLIPRSEQMVISMLSILNAGAAFLPIDENLPEARVAYILEHSGAKYVITNAYKVPLNSGVEPLDIHALFENSTQLEGQKYATEILAEDLAYVIYTSGSTGKPKGVQVSHGNLRNFSAGMNHSLGWPQGQHLLSVTSVSFDIAILELVWTMVEGHTVTIKEDQEIHSFDRFLPSHKQALDFSLFYFPSTQENHDNRFSFLLDSVKFADQAGFKAVWVPERHFHEFGGIFPNPGLLAHAIAEASEQIQIRSGSLVLPLHETERAAQLWASLAHKYPGRAGVSVASGWHADDFVFFSDRFEKRRQILIDQIAEFKKLWTEKKLKFEGKDPEDNVSTDAELPLWVTAAGNPETFKNAGKSGANVLTHMLGQDMPTLAKNLTIYRKALRENGYRPEDFTVSIMLHTYIAPTIEQVLADAKEPFKAYLRSSVGLISNLAKSMGTSLDKISEEEMDDLLEEAFDRYWQTSAMLGTVERATALAQQLATIGVTEIGALVDFGIPEEQVKASLPLLKEVKDQFHLAKAPGKLDRINALQTTPSLLRVLMEDPYSRVFLAQLEHIIIGGEKVPQQLVGELQRQSAATLHQVYGPTETTIWSTYQRIEQGDTVTAGQPIANTQIYIFNDHLELLPKGIPGHVYIGGKGVSQGYLNNEDLTAQSFIENPLSNQTGIIYRTGDLGHINELGQLVISGRSDHQVKINGYRIELSEIEQVLRDHPQVIEAAVVVKSVNDQRVLLAYVQANTENITIDVKEFLGELLPGYMVPKAIFQLEKLPLSSNGKIDRKVLQTLDFELQETRELTEDPSNDIRRTLIELWKSCLLVSEVGLEDNFFKFGGNSLMATVLISKIKEKFQVNVRLKDIFTHPTIASFETLLKQVTNSEQAIQIPLTDPNLPWYPIGYNQLHLWVLAQLDTSKHAFNEFKAFTIHGDFDQPAFEEAFHLLISRHESLRTYFKKIEGSPKQLIRTPEELDFKIGFMDLTDEQDQSSHITARIDRYLNTALDVTEGPLLKAELICLSPEDHLFIYTKNHIISDEWSKRVMMKELITYYNGFVRGVTPEIQPLPIQFRDYAAWQRERVDSAELEPSRQYWKEQLSGVSPVISLPYDHPRPKEKEYLGDVYRHDLGEALYSELQQLSENQSATLFMTLLTGLYVLMHRYSGQEDITIGSPVSGRHLPELEEQIGLYMDALALRQRINPEWSFVELLTHVKETVLQAFEHQDYPFDAILDDLKLNRDVSHAPLFDVLVLVQDDQVWQTETLEAEGITISTYPLPEVNSKFDLTFLFDVSERSINLTIEYSISLFNKETIEQITKDLGQVLDTIIKDPQLLIADENLVEASEFEQEHALSFTQEII